MSPVAILVAMRSRPLALRALIYYRWSRLWQTG
jgi:hypothetical protein